MDHKPMAENCAGQGQKPARDAQGLWEFLLPRAEVLVGRGMPRAEMESMLLAHARAQGWREKVGETVSQAVEQALQDKKDEEQSGTVEELEIVSLADVTPKARKWLWPGRIPLGAVTVISGEANSGKTCFALDLAARVSRGLPLPDGTSGPGAGQVLIVNGDDPLEETIAPRLMGSGADLDNITVIARVKTEEAELLRDKRRIDLRRDLLALWEEIELQEAPRLVILDSLEALCGTKGLGRAQVRELLGRLEDVAKESGVAIVVVSAGTRCELPVKNVWRVDGDLVDSELRCLVPVRCNWGRLPSGLSFRVTEDSLVWEILEEAPTADRTRGATARQARSSQLQAQAAWLQECLADGPLPAKEVLEAASVAGWSAGQMRRAREVLRVVCSKEKEANGQWMWGLAKRPDQVVAAAVNRSGRMSGLEIEDVEDGKDVEDAARELVAA